MGFAPVRTLVGHPNQPKTGHPCILALINLHRVYQALVQIWTFGPWYAIRSAPVSGLLAGPVSWTIIAHHVFVHCALHTTYDTACRLLAKLRSRPMKKISDIVLIAIRYLGSFVKHLIPTALVTAAATI